MESNSGFPEKMEFLDLVITALKEHEKRLDTLSHRLENLTSTLMLNQLEGLTKSLVPDKTGTAKREERKIELEASMRASPTAKRDERKELETANGAPLVICSNWNDFKNKCRNAKTVTFEVENNFFHVYSVAGEDIFQYSERLPEKRLKVTQEESSLSIDKMSLYNVDLLQLIINGRLKCGLKLSIKSTKTVLTENQFILDLSYSFSPDEVKEYFSKELGTAKNDVLEGKITR